MHGAQGPGQRGQLESLGLAPTPPVTAKQQLPGRSLQCASAGGARLRQTAQHQGPAVAPCKVGAPPKIGAADDLCRSLLEKVHAARPGAAAFGRATEAQAAHKRGDLEVPSSSCGSRTPLEMEARPTATHKNTSAGQDADPTRATAPRQRCRRGCDGHGSSKPSEVLRGKRGASTNGLRRKTAGARSQEVARVGGASRLGLERQPCPHLPGWGRGEGGFEGARAEGQWGRRRAGRGAAPHSPARSAARRRPSQPSPPCQARRVPQPPPSRHMQRGLSPGPWGRRTAPRCAWQTRVCGGPTCVCVRGCVPVCARVCARGGRPFRSVSGQAARSSVQGGRSAKAARRPGGTNRHGSRERATGAPRRRPPSPPPHWRPPRGRARRACLRPCGAGSTASSLCNGSLSSTWRGAGGGAVRVTAGRGWRRGTGRRRAEAH
jgi:hypothetical protein